MRGLPPSSDLPDPHDKINEMRVLWNIQVSGPALASPWPLEAWGLLAAALAMAIGAIGPWANALGLVSEGGLQSGGAIVLVVSATLAAGAVRYARRRTLRAALGCLIAAVVNLLIAGADERATSDRIGESDLASVGWGLQTVIVGGIVAVVLSMRALLAARRTRG